MTPGTVTRIVRNLPVPEPHVGGLGAAGVLERLLPGRALQRPLGRRISVVPLAGGVALAAWSLAETAGIDLDRPGELVTTGPYARTRNPMYVAWTLAYVGVAIRIRSRWPLRLLPLVLAWLHLTVGREERALRQRFGGRYVAYAARTPRWWSAG